MDEYTFERWHEFYPRWLAYAREEGARLGVNVVESDDGRIMIRGDRQAELYQLLMDMLIGWGQTTSLPAARS